MRKKKEKKPLATSISRVTSRQLWIKRMTLRWSNMQGTTTIFLLSRSHIKQKIKAGMKSANENDLNQLTPVYVTQSD